METQTTSNQESKAKTGAGGLKAELLEKRVRKYLREIDDLIQTREELLKYVRVLEVMEEELREELEIRREKKKDDSEIDEAWRKVYALKKMFLNKIEIIDHSLKTIVNPNLDPDIGLLAPLSDSEINEFVSEVIETIRKIAAQKVKIKSIKRALEDNSDDFKRYFEGLMYGTFE
jgi:hypothetical protein